MAKKNRESQEGQYAVSVYRTAFGNSAQKNRRKNDRIQCFGKSAIIHKNIIKNT